MSELCVIVPVFNEERNLAELHARLSDTAAQLEIPVVFLFINDGSSDRTQEIIEHLALTDERVRYLSFSRNFGHQIAVSAGIDHAFAEYVAIIDGDLQDPPETLIPMYMKLQEGLDVVYAKRRRRKGESFMKKFTAKVFYRMLKRMTSVSIPVDTGDFRIMRQKVVAVLRSMPEQHKFIRGQIAWAGFRQGFVEYDRDGRRSGKTSYTYGKMTRFAADGITSFSDFPLKLVTWSGFVVAVLSFIVAIYALYSKFILGGAVPGWASLMISLLFLGGVQLLSLGIMGEYISRIASNVRKRPLYIVDVKKVDQEAEGKPAS
jgi:polyisoprenyl-phosphate glycosyltransferase